MMTNLWKETIEKLKRYDYTFDDVITIYGDDFQITKENFKALAQKTDYYSGYGSPAIATDLTILGKDFILKRSEFDGSEWWDVIVIPDISSLNKKVLNVKTLKANGVGWKTLKEVNDLAEGEIDDI